MKILLVMISPANANGGMEKHFNELANGMAALGHQVACVAAQEHLTNLKESISRHPVNTRASRYAPTLHYQLFKVLRRQSFDIAHAHGSKAAALLPKMAFISPRTSRIATVHNFKKKYPNTKCFCHVIAVSKAVAADIAQSNVSVVYNGLKSSSGGATAHALRIDLPKPVWLSVGRLVPAKGFDNLLNAFQHTPGSLIIAGSGPERENLEKQIEDKGLGQRAHLLGHQSDIPSLMRRVDGVVISSRKEGFSYVFAEALFAEKPIISTDVPVANEFLDKEFIIPPGSSPQIFAQYLNRDLEQVFASQESIRKRAREELTIESMLENTLQIYSQCLKS
ncbi:MAG TPA: glycosyltransferase [Marinobacter sp.]|uniref:glycosyltransferase n=1 Tax=Marinobacter sp. TaxID=50741 RepID=UPI002D7E7411|nr:glycosyltransferase [Marinobacter sp.]HET8800827.1 glycosyltransferase [Marinobacter sp.]